MSTDAALPDFLPERYRTVRLLGEGAWGIVCEALDPKLNNRSVAIKVLRPDVLRDENVQARFRREAEALSRLSHPNIAKLYDFDEIAGRLFLVLDLVPGETLRERLAKGRLSIQEGLRVSRETASALQYAQKAGVIHRDLKPANIKITGEGQVVLLDFGLAKLFDPEGTSAKSVTTLTTDGEFLGTPAYMSPEQITPDGPPIDNQADIWALGCILFESLTGKRPFDGSTLAQLFTAIVASEPDWPKLPPEIPPTAMAVLRRCLRKDKIRRPRDAWDIRVELDEALEELAAGGVAHAGANSGTAKPFPPPLNCAIDRDVRSCPVYKDEVAYRVLVRKLNPRTVLFDTELSYFITNRTEQECSVNCDYVFKHDKGRMLETKVDGQLIDHRSLTYQFGRGLRIPLPLQPRQRRKLFFRAVESFRIPDWELYTSFLPATDLCISVVNRFKSLHFDWEILSSYPTQPVTEKGATHVLLGEGVLPYQGVRLSWDRRATKGLKS